MKKMFEDALHESTLVVPQRDDNHNYDVKKKKKKKENEKGKERDFDEIHTQTTENTIEMEMTDSTTTPERPYSSPSSSKLTTTSEAQLLDLPDQVLALVFAHLDFSPSLFLVCKRWYTLYFTNFHYQLKEQPWVDTYVYCILLSTIPAIPSPSSTSSSASSSPTTPRAPSPSTSSSSSLPMMPASATNGSHLQNLLASSSSLSISIYTVGEDVIRNRADRILRGLTQMLEAFPRASAESLFHHHTVTNSVLHIANDLGTYSTLVNFLATDERLYRDPTVPTIARPHLLDLPHYVILRILEFLPMKSLCTVTQTCKTMASIGSESSLWIRWFERRFGAPAYDRLSLREKGGLKRIYANWSRFTKTTELTNASTTVDYFEPNYCTFRTSGRTMMCQRFFVCKTCWPRDSKNIQIGCCVVCAHRCHLGHNVIEIAKCTQAYCDCGEGTLASRLPMGHCGCMN
eukprot:TRINITY_DN3775_c0_g1_i1.p1 TRINITY_DN3775_c0_g1~~TRINITY_DN3775_c0_g1_i1.p1  ORF type:complete len:459 (+),score=61.72 TRINITY_DN3775_c0_g1_i1:387-1763(+)